MAFQTKKIWIVNIDLSVFFQNSKSAGIKKTDKTPLIHQVFFCRRYFFGCSTPVLPWTKPFVTQVKTPAPLLAYIYFFFRTQ